MISKAQELLAAIEAGDIERSKNLLAEGAYDPNGSLNKSGPREDDALIDFDEIHFDEIEVEIQPKDVLLGHWPLVVAARQGSLEMVKLVMNGSGDPIAAARWISDCDEILDGAVKSRFKNAFLEALAGGHGDVAAEMLPHMDWSSQAPRMPALIRNAAMGAAALEIAAVQKMPQMVKLAMDGGAGGSLLNEEIFLILEGALREPIQAWAGAAFSNDLMDMLAPLVNPEQLSAVGEALVCEAVDSNASIEVVKIIINGIGSTWLASSGDSLGRLDHDNALLRSARKGRPDIVEAILGACSEPAARTMCSKINYSHESVLHIVAQCCPNIPSILIERSPIRGSRGNPMSDDAGNTPVHAAIAAKTPANAIAMAIHFDALAANNEGNTPLMLLAKKTAIDARMAELWARLGPEPAFGKKQERTNGAGNRHQCGEYRSRRSNGKEGGGARHA